MAVRGTTPLEDVEEVLQVSFDEEDCDTFGGLLLSRYGYIPKDGSQFEIELSGFRIQVTQIRGHRIETAIVYRISEEENREASQKI